MNKDDQINLLKNMVIFLARNYQANYETFADCGNFSRFIKDNLTPEQYQIVLNIHHKFSSVQGFRQRALVEDIASRKADTESVNLNHYRHIFDIEENSIFHTPNNQEACLENVRGFFVDLQETGV